MSISLRTRIAAAFATALVLIAVVGAAAYRNGTATIADIASLRVARAQLDATREFMQRMGDVETGTRGFVITGNDVFLEPHDSALPYLPVLLTRLRTLESSDPASLGVLDSLDHLVRDRLAFDGRTIALRRARGAAPAAALVATGRGKLLMDAIRTRAGTLEERITADRARRSAVLEATARETRTFVLLAGVLALVGILAALWSILHGLTARERAETRVRELAAELEDLYENAPVGYHSLDADGVYVRINRTELEWLGRTAEEILGKLRFEDVMTPQSGEIFRRAYAQFRAEGKSRDLEYEIIRKDGTMLPILLNASALYDSDGNFVRSRAISIDLTERRRMEAQVKTLRGLLPICASCKKIRDDRGYWNQIESYVREHSEADFSHGICPECAAKLYPEYVERS